MSFNDVYQQAIKSTCFVSCSTLTGSSMSVGSGSVLHPSLVLTNAHVVLQSDFRTPFASIQVFAPRAVVGTPRFGCSARVLCADAALDVAFLLLSVPMPSSMVPATLSQSEAREGDQVFCIGYPQALDESSFSLGYVRSRICGTTRGLTDLSTTIPSFPGNSGSGIFTLSSGTRNPVLAGILTYTMMGGQETLTSGLSLRTLAPAIRSVLQRFTSGSLNSSSLYGCLPRYNFGASVTLVDPFTFRLRNMSSSIPGVTETENTVGYLVRSIVPNSASARAQLLPGDIVVGALRPGLSRTSVLSAGNVILFTEERTPGEVLTYPVDALLANQSIPVTLSVFLVVNKFSTRTTVVVPISLTLIPETFAALGGWAVLGLSLIPTESNSGESLDDENNLELSTSIVSL